ncbi:MAG: protein TolR [Alphaproteobacteria bacterium]|nr:protein TolR [Alphaproteobacteria bacterium]
MGAKLQGGSRRGRATRSDGGFNDINITPFVDVMLVLLIIFMVAAPMMTTGVTVSLPKTQAASVPGNDEPISISIKADGTVYIQNSATRVDQLGSKLSAILGEKKETRIFVRGDTAIDYGQVMRVIGEINSAGFTKVALLTDMSGVPPKN